MNVLIDPYMFELSDNSEIKSNIYFFQKLIELCTKPDNNQRIHLLLYKGIIEKIRQREVIPFPINISTITDYELKKIILQINHSFSNALLEAILSIDIDECGGDQDFQINNGNENIEYDIYQEMFWTLLIPCYSKSTSIDEKIITGSKKNGGQIGDNFEIECSCVKTKYKKKYIFSGIDDFISEKEKIIIFLKEKKKKGEIPVTDNVLAEMGKHHNHVQADKKGFSTLKDLSLKNKRVLILLQKLGLFKVVFGRFSPTGVKEKGTMTISSVDEKGTQDIVFVKFNAETGFQIITTLYFPNGIGKLLYNYFKTTQLNYHNVSELVDKI